MKKKIVSKRFISIGWVQGPFFMETAAGGIKTIKTIWQQSLQVIGPCVYSESVSL